MPHKHTRRQADKSTIDLPPSVTAKPLPVSKSASANGIFTSELSNTRRDNKKRKRNKDSADDTPKAFARLMAFQAGKKLPKSLDDGVRISKAAKKRKLAADKDDDAPAPPPVEAAPVPTIRPGERMSDFAARVDAALPVSGLIGKSGKGGKDPLGLKVGRTKTEKRMHRMYAEWREQDQRIKERREEAQELAEEEAMDVDGQVKWKVDIETNNRTKKGKGKAKGKKKVIGEVDDGEDDPWEQIKRNRAEAKVGLNDVAQAPPTFSKIPREKFRAMGARVEVDDVPKASGSLRRREELGEVRRSVVEGYRRMMKRNQGGEEEG